MGQPLAVIDGRGTILEINESFKNFFAGNSKFNLKDYLPSDFHIVFEAALLKAGSEASFLEVIDSINFETRHSLRIDLYPFEENPIVILAVITDMTVIKWKEDTLITATSGWRFIVDSIIDPICLTDPEGRIKRLNTGFASLVKMGFNEIIGKNLFSIFPSLSSLRETLKTGKLPGRFHDEFDWMDKKYRVIADPYMRGADRISEVIFIFQDITEEKKAERALKDAEFRLSEIMDSITSPIFFKDLDNIYRGCNKAFCDFKGLPAEKIIGSSIDDLFHAEKVADYKKRDFELIGKGGRLSYETMERFADGVLRDVIINEALVMNSNNDPEGIVGMIVDITDMKIAEDKIRASLREKEVLLKEIHHRVKNNLNIIGSLLGLKRDSTDNPAAKDALRESISRVYSMALIHEKLYHSEDLSNINVGEYLESLTASILKNYNVLFPVKIEQNCIDINLDIETMIPLGLILNELMTNSIKYAFTDKKKGNIRIDLEVSGPHMIRFIYYDSGQGIPAGVDIDNPLTLGLQLIKDLVKQMHGKLLLQKDGEMRYEIEFPFGLES
jgi:PAS domain S-box-containing protein